MSSYTRHKQANRWLVASRPCFCKEVRSNSVALLTTGDEFSFAEETVGEIVTAQAPHTPTPEHAAPMGSLCLRRNTHMLEPGRTENDVISCPVLFFTEIEARFVPLVSVVVIREYFPIGPVF